MKLGVTTRSDEMLTFTSISRCQFIKDSIRMNSPCLNFIKFVREIFLKREEETMF